MEATPGETSDGGKPRGVGHRGVCGYERRLRKDKEPFLRQRKKAQPSWWRTTPCKVFPEACVLPCTHPPRGGLTFYRLTSQTHLSGPGTAHDGLWGLIAPTCTL